MGRPGQVKLPVPTESTEQINLFHWASYQLGKYPDLKWMFHIPNGGKRSLVTAKRLKAEGVKPGVPDICLPIPKGKYHGLYIEMKRLKGSSTTEGQEEWIDELSRQGYKTQVCKGWQQASIVIIDYLEERKND